MRKRAFPMAFFAAFLIAFLVAPAATLPLGAANAAAQYQTLYSFNATDGDHPESGLALDAEGNLYGTTPIGGAYNLGVVFRLTSGGAYSVLHDFKGGRDGATPIGAAPTIGADGALYGATQEGGMANGGTVYRLKTNGKIKILHSFGTGDDGFWPASNVLIDTQGNMTGTTGLGGASGFGTVYRIASDGTEQVLHSFTGGATDGSTPVGTLAKDLQGNIFGVTSQGGHGDHGTLYKLDSGGSESVLFNFPSAWATPVQGPLLDRHGNVFGTTTDSNNTGLSAVYKVTPGGNGKVLSHLQAETGNTTTALLRDHAGNLYGTTPNSGGNETGDCHLAGGCGQFYLLAPDKTLTNLHGFGGSDGQ